VSPSLKPARNAMDRLRGFFGAPQRAEVALQFTSSAIIGARVEARRGAAELRSLVSVPLSTGALQPTLEDPGFAQPDELRGAVRTVLARIGAAPEARAALVVPDVVARFRMFPQAEVAADPGQRLELLAFRMQKLLPFAAPDARVVSAFPRNATDPVIGIGFSSTVVRAYERAAESFGLDVGQVETASMALLRGMTESGDAVLVHHDSAWLTVTLVRDGWPVSVRLLDAGVAGSLEEMRREIASTAVFWRDRLAGQKLASAVVHAADPWFEGLAVDLERAFGVRAARAQPPAGFTVAGVPPAIERLAAPALTLLGAA
jgi:hypothetical protein